MPPRRSLGCGGTGIPPPTARQRGAAAVLAMMFLVIFGSLAAAMAVISQGNLRTADSHLKIMRSRAAAETGLRLIAHRIETVCLGTPGDDDSGIRTEAGIIHDDPDGDPEGHALTLWSEIAVAMRDDMAGAVHYVDPYAAAHTEQVSDANGRQVTRLSIPAIRIGPNAPTFEATLTPHPLPLDEPSDLGYDDPFYDRLPYGPPGGAPGDDIYEHDMDEKRRAGIDFIVGSTPGHDAQKDLPIRPLDARFIRVKVTAHDGKHRSRVDRSISMDFQLTKRIPYAILSSSRVMIGRNVMVRGNIGSRFTDTEFEHGHPVQMESDFQGLSDDLDDLLEGLTDHLAEHDQNHDNRINVASDDETTGLVDPASQDRDGDGFITGFDKFLALADANLDGNVTLGEMTGFVDGDETAAKQLFDMMDHAGSTRRAGYGDEEINADDLYSKVHGEISILADVAGWEEGAADGAYQQFFQGGVTPGYNEAPFKSGDQALNLYDFDQHNFDVSSYRDLTAESLDEAPKNVSNGGATPRWTGGEQHVPRQFEEVPYGAEYPYEYYDRPVYENIVFEDILIPEGSNALFINCKFKGVTYIEIETDNGDEDFNYAGMSNSNDTPKHPDRSVEVDGTEYDDTKPLSNNLRFDSCTFEGALVSGGEDGGQPEQFAHVRNKVAFTGDTVFTLENVTDEKDKALYQRSMLLLPHVSVELGSLAEEADADETIELSGAIVAGLIDIRGDVTLNGSIITTFEPVVDEAPVIGETTPNFNNTLGYFSKDAGDMESKLPEDGVGMGKITVTYDPTLALPDGIDGPVELLPLPATYHEG